MGVCYCPRCVQRRAVSFCETRESQEVILPDLVKISLDDIFGGLAFTAFTALTAIYRFHSPWIDSAARFCSSVARTLIFRSKPHQ
jgi:hypothetical protein